LTAAALPAATFAVGRGSELETGTGEAGAGDDKAADGATEPEGGGETDEDPDGGGETAASLLVDDPDGVGETEEGTGEVDETSDDDAGAADDDAAGVDDTSLEPTSVGVAAVVAVLDGSACAIGAAAKAAAPIATPATPAAPRRRLTTRPCARRR
jgi:hypothetical protein